MQRCLPSEVSHLLPPKNLASRKELQRQYLQLSLIFKHKTGLQKYSVSFGGSFCFPFFHSSFPGGLCISSLFLRSRLSDVSQPGQYEVTTRAKSSEWPRFLLSTTLWGVYSKNTNNYPFRSLISIHSLTHSYIFVWCYLISDLNDSNPWSSITSCKETNKGHTNRGKKHTHTTATTITRKWVILATWMYLTDVKNLILKE